MNKSIHVVRGRYPMQNSIMICSRKKSCSVLFGAACFIMDFSDVTGVPPFNNRGSGLSVRGM